MNKDITTRFNEAKRIAMEKERELARAKKELLRARSDMGEIIAEAKADRLMYGQLAVALKKTHLPQPPSSYITQARRGALSVTKMVTIFAAIMKIKTTQGKAA